MSGAVSPLRSMYIKITQIYFKEKVSVAKSYW
jgi:hypothetical protein